MNFRAKLALGFATILALLLVVASYASLKSVLRLSARLRSSYTDSVVPLRNAHLAHRVFHNIQMELQIAVLQRGKARSAALALLEAQGTEFEKAFSEYARGATDEPAMQEVLARYGVQEEMNQKLQTALEEVNNNYPTLKADLENVLAQLRAGNQVAAERAFEQTIPLFTKIDDATNTFEILEVKQAEYLDKESQAVAQAAVWQIPVIASVAMALGILLVLAVARSVTEPLLRLTAAAQKVRAGDLDQVVKAESRDEVGQLALAFNTMTQSLRTARVELENRVEARTRELAAANELLNAQMAERERASQALEQAKDAAESANRTKSEFLAKMSHELRTPLNGVIGAVDLILSTDLGADQREYLQIARTSADALLQVINDILDFSRAESGKLVFEDVDFSLRDVLDNALTTFSVRAAEKGLDLACRVAPEVPEMLVGDPGRLRQVVLNLVGNAIKFTERGRVTVAVQVQERAGQEANLHFAIHDTGIGISPEHQAHIFAPFEQGDGSITRKFGGTGLGLAISAQLVDVMGGLMWVESELGKGSTFHFTARFGVSTCSSPKPLPKRLSQIKDRRVLIVDGDASTHRALQQTLSQWGMACATAATVDAGLTALKQAASRAEAEFHLLLLDCQTPNALVLAEYVKAATNIPIILMVRSVDDLPGSAMACPKAAPAQFRCSSCREYTRCRELGISQYLLKPVRYAQLFEAALGSLGAAASAEGYRPAPQGLAGDDRLRVLVAEDNIINQKIAVRALEKWGHSVDVARNGTEALAKLDGQPFDLILMDLQMPELDGFETTRAIREREKATGRRVPIIAVTAHAMQGDSERCFQAGMDSYVSKPLRLEELLAEIQAVTAVYGPVTARSTMLHRIAEREEASTGELPASSAEIMQAFLSDTPEQLKKLALAAQNNDATTVKSVAHYLKGSALYIGAHRMTQLCKEIEIIASQDPAQVAGVAGAIEMEVARVCAAFESRLETWNCE